MFTTEQIRLIRQLVVEQVTPEEIAQQVGVPYSTFRNYLLQSGYRIKNVRVLEQITPVGSRAERPEPIPV